MPLVCLVADGSWKMDPSCCIVLVFGDIWGYVGPTRPNFLNPFVSFLFLGEKLLWHALRI